MDVLVVLAGEKRDFAMRNGIGKLNAANARLRAVCAVATGDVKPIRLPCALFATSVVTTHRHCTKRGQRQTGNHAQTAYESC